MVTIQIEEGFKLKLPKEVRRNLKIGDELIAVTDASGRIIIFPPQPIQAELIDTFGIWSDRAEVEDAIAYMDNLRKGTRLDETH